MPGRNTALRKGRGARLDSHAGAKIWICFLIMALTAGCLSGQKKTPAIDYNPVVNASPSVNENTTIEIGTSPTSTPTQSLKGDSLRLEPAMVLNYGWAVDAAWSPDGNLLAVASSSGVRIYTSPSWKVPHAD